MDSTAIRLLAKPDVLALNSSRQNFVKPDGMDYFFGFQANGRRGNGDLPTRTGCYGRSHRGWGDELRNMNQHGFQGLEVTRASVGQVMKIFVLLYTCAILDIVHLFYSKLPIRTHFKVVSLCQNLTLKPILLFSQPFLRLVTIERIGRANKQSVELPECVSSTVHHVSSATAAVLLKPAFRYGRCNVDC